MLFRVYIPELYAAILLLLGYRAPHATEKTVYICSESQRDRDIHHTGLRAWYGFSARNLWVVRCDRGAVTLSSIVRHWETRWLRDRPRQKLRCGFTQASAWREVESTVPVTVCAVSWGTIILIIKIRGLGFHVISVRLIALPGPRARHALSHARRLFTSLVSW